MSLLIFVLSVLDDPMGIRDAGTALEVLDLDGDGFIGLVDFIYFARRLKKMHMQDQQQTVAESEKNA
jgi:hypothetical protein